MHLSHSRQQPVDLTLLGHHNPVVSSHASSPPLGQGSLWLHRWCGDPGATQFPKAKPELGDEGQSIQRENKACISKGSEQQAMGMAAEGCSEPSPSITSW